MDINDLKRQRAKHAADARALLTAAQEAGRDLTSDEEQQFDRLMEQADKLDDTIAREEKLREHERLLADRTPPPSDDDRPGTAEQEAERAFRKYVLGGRAALGERELRAMSVSSDPEGGYLVAPQRFVQDLLKFVDDMVTIRPLATKATLTQAESLGVPTLDTDFNDADWTSELATGALDESLRFGKRELRPYPLAKRAKVSRTLLRRSSMDPEAIVRDRLGYKFAVTEEKAFMTGDGNQKPLGLFTASDQGIPTSRDVSIKTTGGGLDSTSQAAADDLIDAKYTLKSQYWPRARWLFHRNVIRDIRKLKDGNGQYLWQPGLTSDRPDTILEVPFVVSEFAPSTMTDEAYIGMIGDFSFYWIVDTLTFEIQRLVELYAETNQIGFIGRAEVDGMPVLAEAFVRLQAEDTA